MILAADQDGGHLDTAFNSGAALATVGSIAVKDGERFVSWLQQYGAARFLLGADVKNEKIAVSGSQELRIAGNMILSERY